MVTLSSCTKSPSSQIDQSSTASAPNSPTPVLPGLNSAPTVSLGADKSIQLPVNSTTLTATAIDPDGTIASYTWTQVSGPNAATFVNSSTSSKTFSNLIQGSYSFRVVVLDNSGGSGQDTINLSVAAAGNVAPTVTLGADKSIQLPVNSMTLTATANDSDGTIVSYTWSQVSGPNTATFIVSNTNTIAFSNLVQGTYTFRVVVTDNSSATAYDDLILSVQAASTSGGLDPNAGKMSLWHRYGTTYPNNFKYDAAVFLPADYGSDASKQYPVIISLHGLGGREMDLNHTVVGGNREGFVKQVWETPLAATFPAIVIAPSVNPPGSDQSLWWQPSALRSLIQETLTTYHVNPKRVVVTGLSAGGFGSNVAVRDSMDLVAAAMPIAFTANDLPAACTLIDFPIWALGNEPDGTFAAGTWRTAQTNVSACPGYKGKFKLEISPTGGHGGWDEIYVRSDIQTWLLNQSKP